MNKQELDMLEKVFGAEIDAALNHGFPQFQTKSKVAKKLEADGLLKKTRSRLGGQFPVTIEGYELTLLGNITYCMSERCRDEP